VDSQLVLATDSCNSPAVHVLTGGALWFGSRSGQKPDPLCLGGVVTWTRHNAAVFWLGGTCTTVPFSGSCNFRSN
jgi:hypothetical protein